MPEVFRKLDEELFKGSEISPESNVDPSSKLNKNNGLIDFSDLLIINVNKDFDFPSKYNDPQTQSNLITLDMDSDSNNLSNSNNKISTPEVILNLILTHKNLDNLIQNKDPSIDLEFFVNPDNLVNFFHSNDNLLNNNDGISIFSVFHLSEIPYHPKPLSGSKPLMYVVLYINNYPIKALVDGRASRSFMGPEGFGLINKLGFKINHKHGLVQAANSHVELVSQEVVASMRLESKIKEMSIRILPSLPVSFLIGSDFLKVIRMDIDFENRTWIFKEDPFKIVIVRKPDGSYQFCLDFIKLNKVTKQDAHPLPEMENILEKLRSAKYISTMDIQKGFLNVALKKKVEIKLHFLLLAENYSILNVCPLD